MKMLIAMFTIAMLGIAAAQPTPPLSQRTSPLSRTFPLLDNDGVRIGTVTMSGGRRAVLRDSSGELIGTLVYEADGTRTSYDPNGNVVGKSEAK
jgi:hypothetical protein